MIEIGSRQRNQPAPPHAVFEALTDPNRANGRPWLFLLDDEQEPAIVESEFPSLVVWSSIWTKRPDLVVRFDLVPDHAGSGTDLRWTVIAKEPSPDEAFIGHVRKRMNQLINAELRFSFGQ